MNEDKQPPQFVQLISGRYLSALDAEGIVWTYTGSDKGWAKLNMSRFSEPKPKPRRWVDPDFDNPDDGIPF